MTNSTLIIARMMLRGFARSLSQIRMRYAGFNKAAAGVYRYAH